MVNNQPHIIVSEVSRVTRFDLKSQRTYIDNGNIYDLAIVQTLVKQHGFFVVNEKADQDMKYEFNPDLSDVELGAFIGQLSASDYKKSERCKTSSKMVIDCDSYGMNWNRQKLARSQIGANIYIKFGFANNIPKCLVVSIHP